MKNFTDNKKFWNTVKPLFSNNSGGSRKITLVKDGKIMSNDKDIAETFNNFFKNSVAALDIDDNKSLLTKTGNLKDPVQIALQKFKHHPSIYDIKDIVKTNTKFRFCKVGVDDVTKQIDILQSKKATTHFSIPAKHLKSCKNIIAEPLMQVWNCEVIDNMKFPSKLK